MLNSYSGEVGQFCGRGIFDVSVNIVPEGEIAKADDDEIRALKKQVSSLSRELRVTKSFLDKVTKTIEAKETLGAVLSVANAKQRVYTDILLESCPNIILLLDNHGCFVLSTKMFTQVTGFPNFDYIKNKKLYSRNAA